MLPLNPAGAMVALLVMTAVDSVDRHAAGERRIAAESNVDRSVVQRAVAGGRPGSLRLSPELRELDKPNELVPGRAVKVEPACVASPP